MIYDSIVIGGGPAGLTSAIYLGRYERKILLLTNDVGGQTAIAGILENFPGFDQINGFELSNKMLAQAKSLEKVEVKIGEGVDKIQKSGAILTVKTRNGEYKTKSIIIASGKKHRKLELKNEDELIGKGISYCATCDGPLSRGKLVAVAGGGNSAIEAVQILSKLANKVTLIVKDEKLKGETVRAKSIEKDKKVEIVYHSEVVELVESNGFLSKIKFLNNQTGETSLIKTDMMFIEIGWVPNTENLVGLVDLNDSREVVVDEENHTSVEGIFGAGDITSVKAKQTIVACGEGAKAAIAVNNYLEKISIVDI